jgi:hypothetical protein
MILPREAIEEFKQIYKKEFGEELSDQDATERATKLLDLYKVIYKSKLQKENDKIQKRIKK